MYNYFDIRGKTIRLDENTVSLMSNITKISFSFKLHYVAEYITLESNLDENEERVRYPSLTEKEALTKTVEVYRVDKEKDKYIFRLVKKDGKEIYTGTTIDSKDNWDLHYDLKTLVEKDKSYISYKFSNTVLFGNEGRLEIITTGDESTKEEMTEHQEQVKEEIYDDIDLFFGVNTKTKTYIKD